MKIHERLEEGALHHENCDSCVTDRPAAKFVLDDEGKLIVRDRKYSCGTFVWGFSVNVMAHHSVSKKLESVVRACSTHSNYHWHEYSFLRPTRSTVAEDFGPLNNEEEATNAYGEAKRNIIRDAVKWRDAWQPKQR